MWTACHPDVDLTEGRTLATNSRGPQYGGYRSAVCGEAAHAMGGGGGGGGRRLYYAEFAVVEKKGQYSIFVGVVPADAAGRAPQEMNKGWLNHPAAHMWASGGSHIQGGSASDWPGMATYGRGDTVGLLLDVEGGSLTAFKNGARLGVVVPNESVPSLGPGPFHWAVDLRDKGHSVRIDATKPPPAAE